MSSPACGCTAGEGDRTAVLFHGFPRTWYAWHGFIRRLVAAGFRVIAVDYRGAVSTTGPLMGEMMREMAEDVTEFRVPRTGHWIAEENPDALMERLRPFLKI
jgi:pimeloyl-ACP methyl ester carboxylesterase